MVGGSGGRGGGSNVKRLEMLVVSLMGQIKLVPLLIGLLQELNSTFLMSIPGVFLWESLWEEAAWPRCSSIKDLL